MKTCILFFCILLCSLTSFAQSSPEEIIKTFFSEYPKNPSKAVEDLYGTNPWISRVRDAVENVKQAVNSYTVDFVGKYHGYESITKKQFSESFVLYSYLVKYDRQPFRFTFEFYKPSDKWMLYSFEIDSEVDEEVEQAAKLYYLKLDE